MNSADALWMQYRKFCYAAFFLQVFTAFLLLFFAPKVEAWFAAQELMADISKTMAVLMQILGGTFLVMSPASIGLLRTKKTPVTWAAHMTNLILNLVWVPLWFLAIPLLIQWNRAENKLAYGFTPDQLPEQKR